MTTDKPTLNHFETLIAFFIYFATWYLRAIWVARVCLFKKGKLRRFSRRKWRKLKDKQMSKPFSQNSTKKIQFLTQTHCLNKPAQLSLTHSMLPGEHGWNIFPCVLLSWSESHTLAQSLSTMTHLFGLWKKNESAQQLWTASSAGVLGFDRGTSFWKLMTIWFSEGLSNHKGGKKYSEVSKTPYNWQRAAAFPEGASSLLIISSWKAVAVCRLIGLYSKTFGWPISSSIVTACFW